MALEGILTADGSEQLVVDIIGAVRFSGYISLSAMKDNDIVVLRQYVKLLQDWEKYDQISYADAQDKPIIYFTPKGMTLKITLQQSAGDFRDFSYKFVEELALPTAEENASAVWDRLLTFHQIAGTAGYALSKILKIQTGRWKIDKNQMFIYDSDGVTPLLTFNLFQDGVPAEFNPDERIPV